MLSGYLMYYAFASYQCVSLMLPSNIKKLDVLHSPVINSGDETYVKADMP